MTTQALPYTMLLGIIFGSTVIAARFGVGQFHPITFVGLRAVLASLGYGAFYVLGRRRRAWPTDRSLWGHAALLGIFGTAVPMTCFVYALQYLSSGVASILITAGPAITILLAHFVLDEEKLTPRKFIGAALALSGGVLMAVRGESGLADAGRANPLGYVLVLLAITCGSGMTVYARRFMRQYDAFDVASVRMLCAALVVMLFGVLSVGIDLRSVDIQGGLVLVYAALASNFGGMFLAFYNIKRFGATASAMTGYIVPVVGALGGVLLLDEQITAGMLIGMGLIVSGIILINWRTKKRIEPGQ